MPMSSLAAELGRLRARRAGADQEGVVGRRQLYAAGVPRWLVRRELRIGRWQRGGRQSVVLHNGPLPLAAKRWVAVIELGPRAALAGVTALQHDGVTALTDDLIHVLLPKGARHGRMPGVVVHESRRFREEDICTVGIRRTKPAVSAVQAALWSVTPRQASFMLILPVQQGLCRPADLAEALGPVRRHRWRKALLLAVDDVAGGVRSLGELDVARAMRRRGLPEPSRQSIRRRPSGTQYIDAEFDDYDLSMEVDGAQHELPWIELADCIRDLDIATEGKTQIRIPLIAWRLDEERVLDALELLFRSRGWRGLAA
jgi:hypothetical protein